MICPRCSAPNSPTDKFCAVCASPLAAGGAQYGAPPQQQFNQGMMPPMGGPGMGPPGMAPPMMPQPGMGMGPPGFQNDQFGGGYGQPAPPPGFGPPPMPPQPGFPPFDAPPPMGGMGGPMGGGQMGGGQMGGGQMGGGQMGGGQMGMGGMNGGGMGMNGPGMNGGYPQPPGFGAPPPEPAADVFGQTAFQPGAGPPQGGFGGPPPAPQPAPFENRAPATTGGKQRRPLAGFLVSFQDDALGKHWPLYQGTNLVGRAETGQEVDVPIGHGTTSTNHARVDAEGGRLTLSDLGSTNGTFHNEEAIGFQGRRELRDGDKIRFGGFSVIVINVASRA